MLGILKSCAVAVMDEQCPNDRLTDGNCIFAAMGRANRLERAAREAIVYKACANSINVTLAPKRRWALVPGLYALHADCGYTPHCEHV